MLNQQLIYIELKRPLATSIAEPIKAYYSPETYANIEKYILLWETTRSLYATIDVTMLTLIDTLQLIEQTLSTVSFIKQFSTMAAFGTEPGKLNISLPWVDSVKEKKIGSHHLTIEKINYLNNLSVLYCRCAWLKGDGKDFVSNALQALSTYKQVSSEVAKSGLGWTTFLDSKLIEINSNIIESTLYTYPQRLIKGVENKEDQPGVVLYGTNPIDCSLKLINKSNKATKGRFTKAKEALLFNKYAIKFLARSLQCNLHREYLNSKGSGMKFIIADQKKKVALLKKIKCSDNNFKQLLANLLTQEIKQLETDLQNNLKFYLEDKDLKSIKITPIQRYTHENFAFAPFEIKGMFVDKAVLREVGEIVSHQWEDNWKEISKACNKMQEAESKFFNDNTMEVCIGYQGVPSNIANVIEEYMSSEKEEGISGIDLLKNECTQLIQIKIEKVLKDCAKFRQMLAKNEVAPENRSTLRKMLEIIEKEIEGSKAVNMEILNYIEKRRPILSTIKDDYALASEYILTESVTVAKAVCSKKVMELKDEMDLISLERQVYVESIRNVRHILIELSCNKQILTKDQMITEFRNMIPFYKEKCLSFSTDKNMAGILAIVKEYKQIAENSAQKSERIILSQLSSKCNEIKKIKEYIRIREVYYDNIYNNKIKQARMLVARDITASIGLS